MKKLVAVLIVGVAACAAREELKLKAAHDLGCDAKDLLVLQPSPGQEKILDLVNAPTQADVRGCGKRLVYARMCKADGSGACDWYSVKQLRIDQLLDRVTFEQQCPRQKIAIRQLDPSSVGVTACGQRSTYVWECPHTPDFYSGDCKWVLNSDSRPATPRAD